MQYMEMQSEKMEQTCTPRRKRKSKSPGDLLGSGKKQQSILTFLSPSSSINRTPDSSCSSTPSRTKMSDSNEGTSVLSQPRRKRSKEKQRSKKVPSKRRLSLIELSSDEEPICGKDLTQECGNVFEESIGVNNESSSCFENVKRNLFQRDKSISQTVVTVSSSEDSDFELHTSKKSHEFFSQFQRSHCTINQDDERPIISAQNLEPSEVSCSSKTLERRGIFITSTPKNERVLIDNELPDPESILVKVEENEINISIQGDAMGRKSNLAVEDYSSLFNAQKTNQKRFRSKLQSSKISPFVDISSSRDENITSGRELRNIGSETTTEIDCMSELHKFVGRESADSCEGQSTIQEDFAPIFSNINQSSVIRGVTHGTVASDKRLPNLDPDKKPVLLQPVAVKIDESDNIRLLQDETMDSSINEERNLIVSSSDIDGDEERNFSISKNNVERTILSYNEESNSPKATISYGPILEKSCNGRISDSEDSQFEGHHTVHKSRMIDDSVEASFEILPPTPTASEVNHESFNARENLTTERALEDVEDTCDQTTNLINNCSNRTESLLQSNINANSDYNPEDQTNLICRPKSFNSDQRVSSSASGEQEKSGESTFSNESKEVSSNSAVGINNEQPLQFGKTPMQNVSSNGETSIEKSYDNGSFPSGVLLAKVNPPITKTDVKGIELSTKISCGVPSAPNLKDMLNGPDNPSLPVSFKTSADQSHSSEISRTEIMLLDAIVSECRQIAASAFDREPLCTFQSLYSSLTYDEKIAFHYILFNSLADEERWQRCPEYVRKHMDRLHAMNLVKYISEHEDSLKLIDEFCSTEIISIYTSLGIKISIDDVDMREALILACKDDSKFGSAEKTKQAIKALACHKFVKIERQTIFCVKMCLELVSMCLHLRDKLYKSVDIGKYLGELLRRCSSNGIQLLPLQIYTSTNLINSETEYLEFVNYCELKAAFESGRLEDHSWTQLVAHMAMLDFNVEQNVVLKDSPLFRLIYTNMVYILDDEFKRKLFTTNREDVDGLVVFGLGILLKQEFTGFGLKGVWSKRKVKYLPKLFSIQNPDVLRDILQQNVSAVENITRSEFVCGLLENKNFGFSPEEKSIVYKYLRTQAHKKVSIENMRVAGTVNSYKVLSFGKKLSLKKPCLFEQYGRDFKHGLMDSGVLLLNLVFLVFWPVIYTRLDNEFVSRYQKCPLDWGSKCFYSKRSKQIHTRIESIYQLGVQGLIDEINGLIDKFRRYHSILDWAVVSSTTQEMYSILEILGLTKFSRIGDYLLQHVEEHQVGLPDLVIWNDSPPQIKFVALKKKSSDPLHPHQIIWLEKLLELGVDAEECHIIPKSTKLQTPVLPLQPIDVNNTMLLK